MGCSGQVQCNTITNRSRRGHSDTHDQFIVLSGGSDKVMYRTRQTRWASVHPQTSSSIMARPCSPILLQPCTGALPGSLESVVGTIGALRDRYRKCSSEPLCRSKWMYRFDFCHRRKWVNIRTFVRHRETPRSSIAITCIVVFVLSRCI